MKIILSRKGFDSTAGGVPSPILPDGRLIALPIPDPLSSIRYGDIGSGGRDIGRLVSNLTGGRIRRTSRAHLDPDLVASDLPRHPDWRPVFGQRGAAQGHLRNQGVGPGDLFVFFGLFRKIRYRSNRAEFDPDSPRRHVIWGWLQVERVIPVDTCPPSVRDWADYHPHFRHEPDPNNILYIAARRLDLGGLDCPGAGVIEPLQRECVLTNPESDKPGRWRLPAWCAPRDGRAPLSYHGRPERWQTGDGHTFLEAAARGQEFVMDARCHPEAIRWVGDLLNRVPTRPR